MMLSLGAIAASSVATDAQAAALAAQYAAGGGADPSVLTVGRLEPDGGTCDGVATCIDLEVLTAAAGPSSGYSGYGYADAGPVPASILSGLGIPAPGTTGSQLNYAQTVSILNAMAANAPAPSSSTTSGTGMPTSTMLLIGAGLIGLLALSMGGDS